MAGTGWWRPVSDGMRVWRRRVVTGAVVDLAGGRVLAEWRGRMPALLVGGCCDGPVGG